MSPPTDHSAAFASAFPAFQVTNTSYKSVQGVPIPTSLLIPKTLQPSRHRHPVIVRWHGGCFITGHRLLPRWFGRWFLEEALAKQAIVVSPDYRLLPEASGAEILEDVRDFYRWLCTPGVLAALLPEGVLPDVEHSLVIGESAGGWIAVQSGLLPGARACISAVIARYPMLDLRDRHYAGDCKQDPFATSGVEWDRTAVATHVERLTGDEVVTSAIPPARMPLVVDSIRGGTLSKLLGEDSSLYPLEAIQGATGYPPLWVIHGLEDRLVPVEGTKKFVRQLQNVVPTLQVHESYQSGPHGFDNDPSRSAEEDWIQQGIEFIAPFWPKC